MWSPPLRRSAVAHRGIGDEGVASCHPEQRLPIQPTLTAMLHAGVLKKFGLYALIRVALPMLPEGAHRLMPLVAWLALGNLVYCGWVAKTLNLFRS